MNLQAFVSYKSQERKIAEKIRDRLQSWGYSTWFDQDNIAKGAYFRDEIQKGLETSDIVVGILTRQAVSSREVLVEWDYAFNGKKRLILLRYEDVQLPYWLVGIQHIDCTKDETDALSLLQIALTQPDTSQYKLAPDYINRNQSKNILGAYRPLIDEKKADNRARMLENVYQAWILGALKPNLQAGSIEMALALKTEAVLRHVDYGDYVLPENSREISQIFHDMAGELLILGEPGSGKTILMLQLAEQLLALAQADETQPIPVILNLSSWVKNKAPLEKWFIEELSRNYAVPKQQAKEWLSEHKITLLLDGLDEVMLPQTFETIQDEIEYEFEAGNLRSELIAALNIFRAGNPIIDIVICSRIREYMILTQKLNLNGAILLRALTDAQISNYIDGANFAGIRELLEHDKIAQELAKNPFILTIMKISYAGLPYLGSPHKRLKLDEKNQENRVEHLFRFYVEKQLEFYPHKKYSFENTIRYLQWLAINMVIDQTTVFYIEDLQPYWVESRYYGVISGGLIGGLLAITLLPIFVLVFALVGDTIGGSIIITWLSITLLLMSALMFAGHKRIGRFATIKFAEKITWIIQKRHLIYGFTVWLIISFIGALTNSLISGFILGFVFVLMMIGLLSQKDDVAVQSRIKPNAGMIQSAKNGLIISIIWGVTSGLLIGSALGIIIALSIDSSVGFTNISLISLYAGLFVSILTIPFIGPMVGLNIGWRSVIQHLVLRFILANQGYIPFGRYDKFLDYAAELGFLRRVGGGYIFRHRMLLEYFAAQYQKQQKA